DEAIKVESVLVEVTPTSATIVSATPQSAPIRTVHPHLQPYQAPPRKTRLDEFLETSTVFRHGKGEYLVDCIVCDKTFINPCVSSLMDHLGRERHKKTLAAMS